MAHMVKCLYCGESFDRDIEEFIKPRTNRYAHKTCFELYADENTKQGVYRLEQQIADQADKKKDIADREHRLFFDCINDIAKGRCEVDWGFVTKEEKRLVKAGYTLSGLTKTFYYVYEILRQPLPETIRSLFLLERYYTSASDYYKQVFLINKANQEKEKKVAEARIVETSITSTKPHIKFFNIGE